MAFLSMDLADLEKHRPDRVEPADFAAFWERTLGEARETPARLDTVPLENGVKTLVFEDATFPGYAGQPIKAWLVRPRGAEGRLPAVVTYIGYGGGRALAHDHLLWASAGYAQLVMDTRGQGAAWSTGDTPDDGPGAGPAFPGSMTRGILDPETYYYRRLYTDAARAIDAVRTHPAVDPEQVLVTGSSQGGGLALAAAGLVPDIRGVAAEVPFLQNIRRATEITDEYPYREVSDFCAVHRDKVETVFRTLSYFDGLNFVARATAPAQYSVGLMDEICPPQTVFASYNHYAGPKEISVYPYNGHEGGGSHHALAKVEFAGAVLAAG